MIYIMTEAQHAQIVDALKDLSNGLVVHEGHWRTRQHVALAMLKAMQPVEPEQRKAELKRGHDDFVQALTDPENQPSQWGTVTLEMYEKLEAGKAALQSAQPVAQADPSWGTTSHDLDKEAEKNRRLKAEVDAVKVAVRQLRGDYE